MAELIVPLLVLIFLQLVLGVDNLLYISIESGRAPKDKQKMVRFWGLGIAIFLRIGLLVALVSLVQAFQKPILKLDIEKIIHFDYNIHGLIVLVGGAFIMYTAVKEIWHMLSFKHGGAEIGEAKPKSVKKVIFMIVIMNLIFSFDSVLSAMAITKNIWIQIIAVVVGGILMIVLSEKVSQFLKKNRKFEVLGLFILFIVGIMLISESAHSAHMELFGYELTAMNKPTFYLILFTLVIVDILQTRYQKKISRTQDKK